ncbi:ANTAR domain-containing protein [uncultured Jatrophihabitans sp.]|uniref:ANTAR domain-containing protein n=1 Tax=uncultured Jatrophihabitans sp. TaxID=1610747 RepID=UPI0035CC1C6D
MDLAAPDDRQLAADLDGDDVGQLRAQVANLTVALHASRRIGTAIGILMASHKITYERAFAMMCDASQNANRKVRDIADDVVETGALP